MCFPIGPDWFVILRVVCCRVDCGSTWVYVIYCVIYFTWSVYSQTEFFLVECSGQEKAVRPLGMFVFVCLFVCLFITNSGSNVCSGHRLSLTVKGSLVLNLS